MISIGNRTLTARLNESKQEISMQLLKRHYRISLDECFTSANLGYASTL